jgi:Spy/CpxP family protein refolding chaperone
MAVIGVAWAMYSGNCSAEGHIGHVTERIGRKLELNDNQQGHLQAFAQNLLSLRSERQNYRLAMKDGITELLSAPSLDRERAVALIDERYQAIDENKRTLVEAFADFSDSLAPEQRSRLAGLIGDRLMHRWGPPGWAHD